MDRRERNVLAMRTGVTLILFMHVVACGSDVGERACTEDSECLKDGTMGRCLLSPASASKWCAFDDPACSSGTRWGSLAGDSLAMQCMSAGDGGGLPPDASLGANT